MLAPPKIFPRAIAQRPPPPLHLPPSPAPEPTSAASGQRLGSTTIGREGHVPRGKGQGESVVVGGGGVGTHTHWHSGYISRNGPNEIVLT